MRKITLIFVCFLIIIASVSNIKAESARAASDETKFYINFGALSNDSFNDFWWQTGVMVDFPLGDYLLLSPEAMLIGWKFDFDEVYLYPGATINLKFGEEESSFFVGAGFLIYFYLAPEVGGGDDLMLKIQGGFIGNNIKLTVYMYDFLEGGLFDYVYFGANLGFAL